MPEAVAEQSIDAACKSGIASMNPKSTYSCAWDSSIFNPSASIGLITGTLNLAICSVTSSDAPNSRYASVMIDGVACATSDSLTSARYIAFTASGCLVAKSFDTI